MGETVFHAEAGEFITKDEATKMHQSYKENFGKEAATNFVFYGINKIKRLLDKNNVTGLKIYFAQAEDGSLTTVLAAADANGQDVALNYSGSLKGDSSDYLDKGPQGPPFG